ncbi:TRAP transporter large permease [Rhodovulum sulfidophilum]|uniref:TRAP transporter large permease n=1 Tax=Rhodovulum sulfidophilum TaxID=35806 RepID=A0ABS1RTH9_RHOSU|nr:TRAP transporter large permease [Rhodovulum sulfidophilum]MBL3609376.1 TRAP transporter large permease [Rhodovulum sulfidophilum]MCE8438243.1 TRAP transporter large permease [Rhodovulum sulfidophilum]MCE8455544.1 TRAP transporter large permease [Rhodovulum sulfidophilum]
MEWALILLTFFSALLLLMLTGINVFVAFLTVNLTATALLIGERGFGLFVNSVTDSVSNGGYATIPLFILMGEILFRSGSVDVLFDSVDRLVGRVRGRLYAVVIVIATIFGALSGTAVAVSAMLGRSAMPTMEARGYSPRLSATVILAGASLAPIIPPSLLAIIIGSLADVSIAGLLIAGIIPGIIISIMTGAYVTTSVMRNPELAPPQSDDDEKDRGSALGAVLRMMPFMFIIFMVMGMIMLGIATPGESAATGVVGSVLVAILYKRASAQMLISALASATRLSVMIMVIVASSTLFSQLVAFTGASRALVAWATDLGLSPMVMFFILMALPLVLCMFIDQIAFLLMAVPLYEPLVSALGYDPIWFWTIFLINLTVGGVTPPFGYTLFALSAAAPNISVGQVFRASYPVLVIFLLAMLLLTFVPGIVTWLPSVI